MRDHPIIEQVEQWGYPHKTGHEYVMVDSFKNEIYKGDEYYQLDDEIYLIEPLSNDAIEILKTHGATKLVAK